MNQLTNTTQTSIETVKAIGLIANEVASNHVFTDYLSRKSTNTLRSHRAALSLFADYLNDAGVVVTCDDLQTGPQCWAGLTWGIVKGFVSWMIGKGYSMATVNNRLSVIKTYAKLASQAGTIPYEEIDKIKAISAYSQKESKRVDEKRKISRVSSKKVANVVLSTKQANELKRVALERATNIQRKRDVLLMCLLLDHGLRVSEVAQLSPRSFDMESGTFTFYRPKTDSTSTHKMTVDTLKAAVAYFEVYPARVALDAKLLLTTYKSGSFRSDNAGMSIRAINKRVTFLGENLLNIDNLSPHDCRHYCATDMSKKGYGVNQLCDWFGWASPAMALRYINSAEVAERDKG